MASFVCCKPSFSVLVLLACMSVFVILAVSAELSTEGCGQQVHSSIQGSITSPGYPGAYPSKTSCVWQIKGSRGSIISISFVSFDVDDVSDSRCNHSSSIVDQHWCCSTSWLKIGVPDTEEPLVLCGSGYVPKPYLSSGPELFIKFHSGASTFGHQGFKLLYLVIPLEVPCRPNETSCGSNSYECHPKCDHVMQCSNGFDEMGCVKGCKDRIMCSSWSGCYLPDERCNGVAQCGDHSDERNCSPDLCRSDRGGFLCNNLQCIRESWQCDQTNDCGDNSDEVNCLKNSVITAAIMGSLICGLLLVIAIGCTCKLYALRYNEAQGTGSRATLPMSPLEQEMLHREPPPPYSIAVSQPPLTYFTLGSQSSHSLEPFYYARMCRGLHHHRRARRIRRQRRQPPLPPPCLLVVPPDPSVISGSTSGLLPQNGSVATGLPDGYNSQYSQNANAVDGQISVPPSNRISSILAVVKAPEQGELLSVIPDSSVTVIDNRHTDLNPDLSSSRFQVDGDDCPLLDHEH